MFFFFFAQFCLVELWNDYKSLTCTKTILHIYCRKKITIKIKTFRAQLTSWSNCWCMRSADGAEDIAAEIQNICPIALASISSYYTLQRTWWRFFFALMISDNCMLLSHCVSPFMLGKAFIVASTIMAKYKSTRKQLCNVTKLSKKASEKNLKNHVVIADEGSPNKLRAGEMEDQASVVFNRIVTLCHSQYYQKVMELRNIFLISLISCLSQTWSFADITRH